MAACLDCNREMTSTRTCINYAQDDPSGEVTLKTFMPLITPK